MGAEWIEWTREGFPRGERRAGEQARLAAAVAALSPAIVRADDSFAHRVFVDASRNSQLGESCSMREGQTSGRCIPTWWGICHAWAPAAIL